MCPLEPVRSASDTQFLQSWPFILNKWYKQNFLDSFFLKELKKVEEIPIYKKNDPLKKENYRPCWLIASRVKDFRKIDL